MMGGARHRWTILAMTAAVVPSALLAAGCSLGGGHQRGASTTPASPPHTAAERTHPNVVFILTDDLSTDLVPYMPHVVQMEHQGATFTNAYVTDSLCCPSRTSIFSGKYPHSTGVFTNTPPDGGFTVFHARHEESDTLATALHGAGYATALMGKYLNLYEPTQVLSGHPGWVPPGWGAWSVAGNGYRGFRYRLAERDLGQTGSRVVHYGHKPPDYLTDVIAKRGRSFISSAAIAHRPFFLELATFAPHRPFNPAPADRAKFPGLQAPRVPNFNAPQLQGQPGWLPPTPLKPVEVRTMDRDFRKRVQSVQSVDRMIAGVEAQLRASGEATDTYLVFSSDNGLHLGNHELLEGKQTAFDSDIHVPLVVVGPGIQAGTTITNLVSNIDLRPTFQALGLASNEATIEGRSLVPLLHGKHLPSWRGMVAVEHHGVNSDPRDPDNDSGDVGDPPGYVALRFAHATWVQYLNPSYSSEYYDDATDPWQRRNIAPSLTSVQVAKLHAIVARIEACTNAATCHAADQATDPVT